MVEVTTQQNKSRKTKHHSRIAWTIIVISALITSVVLLWISWKYNAETPTTTVISNNKTHWTLTFDLIDIRCRWLKTHITLRGMFRFPPSLSATWTKSHHQQPSKWPRKWKLTHSFIIPSNIIKRFVVLIGLDPKTSAPPICRKCSRSYCTSRASVKPLSRSTPGCTPFSGRMIFPCASWWTALRRDAKKCWSGACGRERRHGATTCSNRWILRRACVVLSIIMRWPRAIFHSKF